MTNLVTNNLPTDRRWNLGMVRVAGSDLLPGDQILDTVYIDGVAQAGATAWTLVSDDTTVTVDGNPLLADRRYVTLTSDQGNRVWLQGWRGPSAMTTDPRTGVTVRVIS